jgi:hypothetical protein
MEAILFSETVTPKQRSHSIVRVRRRSYVLVHADVSLTQLHVRGTDIQQSAKLNYTDLC